MVLYVIVIMYGILTGYSMKDDLKEDLSFSVEVSFFFFFIKFFSFLITSQVFGFKLTAEDMDRIRDLHTNQKLIHLTYPIWKG